MLFIIVLRISILFSELEFPRFFFCSPHSRRTRFGLNLIQVICQFPRRYQLGLLLFCFFFFSQRKSRRSKLRPVEKIFLRRYNYRFLKKEFLRRNYSDIQSDLGVCGKIWVSPRIYYYVFLFLISHYGSQKFVKILTNYCFLYSISKPNSHFLVNF